MISSTSAVFRHGYRPSLKPTARRNSSSPCATLIKRTGRRPPAHRGRIFDRGPRADIIMDLLMEHHSVDIQWGNRRAVDGRRGSRTCIATVLSNSITYNNLDVIETGYGISLRPLALFADEKPTAARTSSCFPPRPWRRASSPRWMSPAPRACTRQSRSSSSSWSGQTIAQPSFQHGRPLLLDKIDFAGGTVRLPRVYPLRDYDPDH